MDDDGGVGGSRFPTGEWNFDDAGPQLDALQRQHEEKMERVRELKRQVESTELLLKKRRAELPKERVEAFGQVKEKYDKVSREYNEMLLSEFRNNKKMEMKKMKKKN